MCPFNDMDALERAADDSTVGVLLEPIQGESGVNVADRDVPARRAGLLPGQGHLLFMLDEVQTGDRPTRHALGLRAVGRRAGHHDAGQGPRRRRPDRRVAGQGVGLGIRAGRSRLHLRRQSADVRRGVRGGDAHPGKRRAGNVQRVGGPSKKGLEALQKQQPLITPVRGDGLLLAIDLTVDRCPRCGQRFGFEEGVLLNRHRPEHLPHGARPELSPRPKPTKAVTELKKSLDRLASACRVSSPGPPTHARRTSLLSSLTRRRTTRS